MTSADPRVNELLPPIEGHHWQRALRAALSSAFTAGAITGGIYLLSEWIERDVDERTGGTAEDVGVDDNIDDDQDARESAELLAIPIDASERDIRSALRARFREAPLHPDHGGDERRARDLIAAHNLLIERARHRQEAANGRTVD